MSPSWTKERLLAKTRIVGECWEWQGYRDANGYGDTWFHKRHIRTHVVSWILHNGELPPKTAVLHRCDNPPCIRPDHLFVGTDRDNVIDMRDKGRHGTAKLTQSQADEIRTLYRLGIRQTRIGVLFGISQSQVSDIVLGRCWGTVPREMIRRKPHLSPAQISDLKRRCAAGEPTRSVAARFSISTSRVRRILARVKP